jgi:dihydroorotate dehydrogenase (fumarate)
MGTPSLATQYAGLRLKNPVVAASAGTTRDADHAKRAEDAGCSAVVLKSVQEELVNRFNPFPRFAVIRNGISGYSSTTFYSYEQAFEGGIEEYAETVRETKRALSIPVIASLNCVKPESWREYAAIVERAGADAIEVVPSCPVGLFLRDALDFNAAAAAALKEALAGANLPVVVKLTIQLGNPLATALEMESLGAAGLTMFNRSTGMQIDLDTMKPILHGGVAGHGGPWVAQMNMRWIAEASKHLGIPISATGGASRWEDVARYLLAGAANIQIGSAIYVKGYNVIGKILDGFADYLEEKEIDAAGLIGKAARAMVQLKDVDRSGKFVARIDHAACARCGRCRGVCIYDAIRHGDGKPAIDPGKCDGCGLCPDICGAHHAIGMFPA